MLRARTSVVLLILVGSSDSVRSGAWVQSKRACYLKLSSSYLSTTGEFNYRGARMDLFEEHPGFTDGSFLDFNLTTWNTAWATASPSYPTCSTKPCALHAPGSSAAALCDSEKPFTPTVLPI